MLFHLEQVVFRALTTNLCVYSISIKKHIYWFVARKTLKLIINFSDHLLPIWVVSNSLFLPHSMTDSSMFLIHAIPNFDGFYDHWAILMENLLRSKKYWELIEYGVTLAPPNAMHKKKNSQMKANLRISKPRIMCFKQLIEQYLK